MSQGFFLVLEGPEGAGKTTLAAELGARFRAAGQEPVLVREPGGTPAAEALRRELLHADRSWTPERELLYLATARADLVGQIIRPALQAGRVVLSDRYDLSTLAYQAAGRGLPLPMVTWVNRAATGGLRPDLTLILDLPSEVGSARQLAAGKQRDRLDREPLEFHRRVAARYRDEQGPGVAHLDATLPPAELAAQAWAAVMAARPGLLPAGAR
ncbi:MAG TPA: dTMP kinase [Gemmatimonadales bacterium]|jgi:dTMP kinase|nr:dTMP kinase [Gemmatimonadales bacterium]